MEFIEIGGEKRPVKYGWNAVRLLQKAWPNLLNDIDKEEGVSLEKLLEIILIGLKEGARISKVEFNSTIEDVADWLDEDTDKANEFIKTLIAQMPKSKKVQAP
ncbi:MAG: hypothetical protein MUO72_18440 [Bacteroidales bacterium]|nr:hypothetical protein [Bacteroidales bacterium]